MVRATAKSCKYGFDSHSLFSFIFFNFLKEELSMWNKLGTVALIGSIIFGLLQTVCDAKEVKDRIQKK